MVSFPITVVSHIPCEISAIVLEVNFCKDHRDKTEVPDPLAVEDLICFSRILLVYLCKCCNLIG